MSKTRRRLVTLFTIIGIVTTSVMLLMAVAVTCTCVSKDRVPERTVLELRLDHALAADGAADPLASVLGGDGVTVQQVIESLERAAHDDRVVGVVAYLDGTMHGMARVEELREAIAAFRASGKPAVAFAETFGEMGMGTQGYYLATAFDEIYLQPSGSLGLTGLRSERMYYRGALDKLDVVPNGDRRSEYKAAYERYAERHMSEADREQTTVLLDEMHAQVVTAVAGRLGGDEARARELIAKGPYLAAEAKELGLVDGLAYRDEVQAKLEAKVGKDAKRLYVGPYLERAGGPWEEGEVIAIVHGNGLIARGPSAFDPIEGSPVMGAETIVGALRAAAEDPEVKAIVFRVDSPGGSAVASDTIWRAVRAARDAGKPVVVSMGNVAASGGYYVSASATKIVAQPSTITGSIGVVAGKAVTRGLWNKLGVTFDSVQTSPNAGIWSSTDTFDGEGWAQLQLMLDRVYADFKQRVAEGRGLSPEQVEQVARGRVWTGAHAKEIGLVDELGGLHTAIAIAKREAGIAEDAPIELRRFPASKGLLAKVLGGDPDNSDEVSARVSVGASVETLRELAAGVRALEMSTGEAGALVVAPLVVQ